MKRIGFIGASGLMGHGIAKNLLAKGHPLALTVHRNRERVADLLAAGATEAESPAALARTIDIVFHQSLSIASALGHGAEYVTSLVRAQQRLTGARIVGR